MYHILNEPLNKDWLDEWVTITGDFDQIKGYTDLGDVFVINSQTNEIGILFTMQNSFKPMGFTDWDEFNEVVLNNPRFQEDVIDSGFIERVKKHCGELGDEQVYIAILTPAPEGQEHLKLTKKVMFGFIYRFQRKHGHKFNKAITRMVFKLHFCHSAALHFMAKMQLKNHRLLRR